MFKKILLPTDGSEAAGRAAVAVASLVAAPSDVQITLLVVIAPLAEEHSDLDPEVIARKNAQQRRHAEDALEATARIFADRGVAATGKVVEGDPASAAIAAEAAAGRYDLVALGSRGMGLQKDDRRYVGSVAEHVIRRVRVPVLVLPVHPEE